MVSIPSPDDLKRLVASGTAESNVLEFKAAPWDRNDAGKREVLKDITAFANTHGGVILVGVTERSNAATGFAPIDPANAETERSRINDLITNGVEPRLYGVNIAIAAIDGGSVLAIAIPRSPSRPHRVTTQNWNRIWLRNSTGAYEANMADLRNLFLQSAEITERAERYHRDRLPLIRAGDIVQNLNTEPSGIVIHVIPADAFTITPAVDPKRAYELEANFRPIGRTDFSPRFTFDGFLNLRGGETCHGYTLVRRDGIVEAIKVGLSMGEQLPIYPTEARIVHATRRYAEGLFAAGVVPPLYVYVTLQGAGGRRIAYENSPMFDDGEPISRSDLHLPVAVIEDSSEAAVAAALKPAFDAIWNAGGYVGSLSYETGVWMQKGRE